MKQQYRSLYDNLTAIRKEIQFCQHKVDQSRHKMMEEFDVWYKQCYLGDGEQEQQDNDQAQVVMATTVCILCTAVQVVESNQELFDKVQAQLLNNDINTQAFYHARTRTDKRVSSRSVYTNPNLLYDVLQLLEGSCVKRKPGAVTSNVKNKPPTLLTVT